METELEAGAKILVDYINHKAYFQVGGKNQTIPIEKFTCLVRDNVIVQVGDFDGVWIYEHVDRVKTKQEQQYKETAVERWLSRI